jgi:hypothetical protein
MATRDNTNPQTLRDPNPNIATMLGLSSVTAGKGWGYIILNTIRGINLLILTTIAASSVSLMVVAKMPNGFTFFSDVSLAFIIGVCVILVMSELGFCKTWINRNWPTVGHQAGFTWLGIAMIIMGSHTLGELSDARNSPETMSLPFWRLCIGSGVVSIFFGFVNILTSWLYGNKNGLCARNVRSNGATADNDNNNDYHDDKLPSYRSESFKDTRKSRFTMFGRGGKPNISGPIRHDIEQGDDCPVDNRGSPVIPGLQRPPTLMHPAVRASEYSVASNINRF